MKVRITKNNDENYWYNDRIGEVFEVEEAVPFLYYRANGRYKGCYIDKDDCEIIKENPLEGADKLSKQIITTEWAAKMPQAKQEDKMKEYVALQPQLGVKPEDIKVIIDDGAMVGYFSRSDDNLYINPAYIRDFISDGIIAEKKSKAQEILDNIKNSYENNVGVRMHLGAQQIILQELEKAGIE